MSEYKMSYFLYINPSCSKNPKKRYLFGDFKEGNIYRYLHSLGFRRIKDDERWKFVRLAEIKTRTGKSKSIKTASIENMVDCVESFIKNYEYDLPFGAKKEDILEHFYRKLPIVKDNYVLRRYLNFNP